MKWSIEPIVSNAEVNALLSSSGLPISNLDRQSQVHLFGARSEGKLIGVVGIEVYAPVWLLRSLVVAPEFRNGGGGRALATHAETRASQLGVQDLYLLTTTAAGFFARLGYEVVSRADAPMTIAQTTQFAGLCPSSSAFMRKKLAAIDSFKADNAVGPRP
jgi:amino-acid N-acetyltransferase